MKKFLYVFVCSVMAIIFRFLYRYKVYGAKNLDLYKSAIIASNHVSFLDPILIAISSRRGIHFFARDTLFKNKLLSFCFSFSNVHPIARGTVNVNSLKLFFSILKEGNKVVLFPEGARSENGDFKQLRSGVALLAYRSGMGVIPTYVHGTYEAWSKRRKLPKLWGKVACVFGSPLFCAAKDFSNESKQMFLDKLAKSLQALKDWYEAGAIGQPP